MLKGEIHPFLAGTTSKCKSNSVYFKMKHNTLNLARI